jgi:hypothetical protein
MKALLYSARNPGIMIKKNSIGDARGKMFDRMCRNQWILHLSFSKGMEMATEGA